MESELPYRRSILENELKNFSSNQLNSNDLKVVEQEGQEIVNRYNQVSK